MKEYSDTLTLTLNQYTITSESACGSINYRVYTGLTYDPFVSSHASLSTDGSGNKVLTYD